MLVLVRSLAVTHMSVLIIYICRISIVLSSHNTFDTDWSWACAACRQTGRRRLKNAGRLQVPGSGLAIGFFFEKDSWRFGGGEWLHVINAL